MKDIIERIRQIEQEQLKRVYIEMLRHLVAFNPAFIVSDEGFDYNLLLSGNASAAALFELVLHTAEPNLPANVQQWIF